MTDQDLMHALEQTQLGTAALGLCIVRVLVKSDSTFGLRIEEEAKKMQRHLSQNNLTGASQILSHFRMALANPEKMPLLSPDD